MITKVCESESVLLREDYKFTYKRCDPLTNSDISAVNASRSVQPRWPIHLGTLAIATEPATRTIARPRGAYSINVDVTSAGLVAQQEQPRRNHHMAW